MPQISGDTYLPLNAAQKAEAANYAQNLIRRGGLTDAEIVQKTGERVPGTDQSDLLALYNIVRQSHRAVDAAAVISAQPNVTPSADSIPNTPGLPSQQGNFIYDVVITVTDPVTGEKYTTREEMVTTIPMSIHQLREEVLDNQDRYIRNATSPPPPLGFTNAPTIDVMLLDVGRGS